MICDLCHSDKLSYLVSPRLGGQVWVCARCTNASTFPKPVAFYDDHPFYAKGEQYEDMYISYMRPIVQFITCWKKAGRLLDVGTGAGVLIREALAAGYKAEGIEPSKSAVSYCRKRKLTVKQGYFQPNSFPAGTFDVVVMSHVMEHLADPTVLLRAAHKALKRGGILCLSQTNYTGTLPKYFRGYWEGWVTHEHFYHFSPKGIRYLLEKNGFDVKEVSVIPLGYSLFWRPESLSTIINSTYAAVNYTITKLRLGFPFIGDQMYVAATPKK